MNARMTAGELRQILKQNHITWTVSPALKDTDPLPDYPLGGQNLLNASDVSPVDLHAMLSQPPGNQFLLERRMALGYIKPETQTHPAGNTVQSMIGDAFPDLKSPRISTSVDWRNRWGNAWITTVQDQDPCNSCWAFAATALVETMVRIEHCVWSKRSEGDVRDGWLATLTNELRCNHTSSIQAPFDFFINANGLADPACWPWQPEPTTNIPYTPCPDRAGRTVKIAGYTNLGAVSDQKTWIDATGPIIAALDVYTDFQAYGGGVYHRLPNATWVGQHILLIIGYDDTQQCWIVKNSWGSGWGEAGFGRIGYGEVNIDYFGKVGLQNTNPDPLTKRRLHNGTIIESGNGATHRNFEMLATTAGTQIRHWWRQGGEGGDFSWHQAYLFGNDAAVCPTLTATTFNRNFECVYLTTSNRLHHWAFGQPNGPWGDNGIFGPPDAAGIPGFVQGNSGVPGNFEVVVRTADGRLNHWWRDNTHGFTWNDGGRFASNIALSGATLVQGQGGNLELVAVLTNGQMQHWWRDSNLVWHPTVTFGSNVSSPPCMIEGQSGASNETISGNFELCVQVGGQVQHWFRDHQSGNWYYTAAFAGNVKAVAAIVESSSSFHLEVILLLTSGQMQHYWRDSNGYWNAGPIIGSYL